MIDIRNFVDIQITPSKISNLSGSRPKVLVYGVSSETTSLDTDIVITGSNTDYTIFYNNGVVVENLDANLTAYAKIFFMNGGAYLTFTKKTLNDIVQDENKKAYEDTIVFVQFSINGETSLVDNSVLNDWTGIYEKVLVYRMPSSAVKSDTFTNATAENVAVKVSDEVGAEMTIASYLSHIDCYKANDVNDYDFTQEQGIEEDLSNTLSYTDDDSTTKSLQNIPFNFEMKVGSNYLNIGGNAIGHDTNHKSFDIVEKYVTIVLTQNLTSAVFNALSTKLSGNKGLGSIRTAMSAELDRYVNSGFLVTDKVWMNDDLIMPNAVDSSLDSETIIEKNTPIANGYYIHLFRLSKDERKTYAFVILTTRKGIRFVQVDGWTM